MRITMDTMMELAEAVERVKDASEVSEAIQTWIDLDGETDADSRDARREARDEIEGGIDELEDAVRDLATTFGIVEAKSAQH